MLGGLAACIPRATYIVNKYYLWKWFVPNLRMANFSSVGLLWMLICSGGLWLGLGQEMFHSGRFDAFDNFWEYRIKVFCLQPYAMEYWSNVSQMRMWYFRTIKVWQHYRPRIQTWYILFFMIRSPEHCMVTDIRMCTQWEIITQIANKICTITFSEGLTHQRLQIFFGHPPQWERDISQTSQILQ